MDDDDDDDDDDDEGTMVVVMMRAIAFFGAFVIVLLGEKALREAFSFSSTKETEAQGRSSTSSIIIITAIP